MSGRTGGVIRLRSGVWTWRVEHRDRGGMVVLSHRDQILDEMRTWSRSRFPSDEEVRELAVDAPLRRWRDDWGKVWDVTREAPAPEVPAGDEPRQAASTVRLRFSRGATAYVTRIPATTRLGEVTHQELSLLLKGAWRIV